jgi:hypothetical protein
MAIGHFNMGRISIRLRIYGDRMQAYRLNRSHNTASDLTTIGDHYPFEILRMYRHPIASQYALILQRRR